MADEAPNPSARPPNRDRTFQLDAWAAAAAVVWLALIVALYYVSHKPLTREAAAGLFTAGFRFFAASALISLAGGLGLRLAPLVVFPPLVRLSMQAALGLGLLALTQLLVGTTLGVGPGWAWGALLALALLTARAQLAWLRQWGDLARLWRTAGRLGRALAVACGAILAAALALALAPPLGYDALVYHLSLPRLYLAAGSVHYVPEIMFWGMPQVGEMVYTWALALAGAPAAAVVGWWVGALALAGILGFCAWVFPGGNAGGVNTSGVNTGGGNAGGVNTGWVALAALLSGLTLVNELAWAYVDWFTLLFGAAFLFALAGAAPHGLTPSGEGDRRLLWLAGVYAGLAFGAKYTAGILALAGVVSLLWPAPGLPVRARFGAVFQFGLAAGALALPWLLRNWLATGNPVYPLLFPGGAMDAARLALYQGGEAWGNWLDVVFLPLRATLAGREGAPGYNASTGPLLLGLGALAGLAWGAAGPRGRAALRQAAIVGGTALVLWALLGRFTGYLLQTRLYLAVFPALAVLAAAGYVGLSRRRLPGVRLGRLAGALILLVAGLSAFEAVAQSVQKGAWGVVLGQRAPAEYLRDNLGYTFVALDELNDLPAGSRTLLLWEPRGYFCAPSCDPDEVLDRWLHDRQVYGDPQAILAAWRQAGYTHVLVYERGAEFLRAELHDPAYTPEDWQAAAELFAALPRQAEYGGFYGLYRLAP